MWEKDADRKETPIFKQVILSFLWQKAEVKIRQYRKEKVHFDKEHNSLLQRFSQCLWISCICTKFACFNSKFNYKNK